MKLFPTLVATGLLLAGCAAVPPAELDQGDLTLVVSPRVGDRALLATIKPYGAADIHHLLPQFYMRAFASDRGQVRVVERASGREFTTGTANVFVERDFYTVSSVRAHDDHGLIEGLYAKVEGVAAPVFEQLRRGDFPLASKDRSEFASFLALQVSRGRMFRRFIDEVLPLYQERYGPTASGGAGAVAAAVQGA